MYKDEVEQNRKLLVLVKQIHLNNSESTFNEKRRKNEIERKIMHCFCSGVMKKKISVPVKEIDFHVHRGVNFHINDAVM